ncbi:MAG TPA: family 20 glycosylhydrolase [Candidatus Methylacidiphilales bacterium]
MLFPPPRRLRLRGGRCRVRRPRLRRLLDPSVGPGPEAYRLTVDEEGAAVRAATERGLFYGERTWRQVMAQCAREGASPPCLEIADWPAYEVRGFYHDVSRGKVPTLRTLLGLAERCAAQKLNHLELYVEHTYAYRNHPEVWRGADPLTADKIRALDARCAALHIDLVPSFSTFGHCYGWIRDKFPGLNELERDVSHDPFSWKDRMDHYTLDCRNPASLALVREIVAEVRPLFRSRFFNLCGDETFDLGRGRNRELAARIGKGRLYVDFLKQVMEIVRENGATPLFWGDVIGHDPKLLGELPAEAVLLDWDYSAALSQTRAAAVAGKGRRFFVCPSVAGHNRWLPDYATAHANIVGLSKLGRKSGASGLLATDWGDYGHIHSLGAVWPGLVLGAAAAWNPESAALRKKPFRAAVSRHVFGDATGRLMGLLESLSAAARAPWTALCWVHQARSLSFPEEWIDRKTGLPHQLLKSSPRVHAAARRKIAALGREAEPLLMRCRPDDRLLVEEVRVGILGLAAMEEMVLFHLHRAGKSRALPIDPAETGRRLRELDRRLSRVWRSRNKASEYRRIAAVLRSMGAALGKGTQASSIVE